MLEAGKVLQNRYRIEKPIGQGGMGAVYIATDERFASRVAIKETFFSDKNYGKAFEREARLLNNLRHPALPRVSDHFIEENGQFLVMEYIDGDDLSEKMQENGSAFALKDVLDWADQLLDALEFLHTQETPVIHRDIKPQNLKLTARGQIILLDFGLAKGSPTDASHKTAAHSVFGYSKNYASLEQMQGTGTDPRSDLYSLGATLYHLMTGKPPIDALTRAMTVLNDEKDPLPPANLMNERIPVKVAEILARAMALNANHRPESAMAMRKMLAESENTVLDEFKQVVGKKTDSGVSAQRTEIIRDTETSNQTAQIASSTQKNSASDSAAAILGAETIKNLKKQKIAAKPDSAFAQSSAKVFGQKREPKNGLMVGAVLGGLLMAGSAAGVYFVKPEFFRQAAQSENQILENVNSSMQSSIEETPQNNSGSNSSANTVIDANSSVVSKKESVAKSGNKASAQASVNSRNDSKPQASQSSGSSIKENTEMGENDVKVSGDRIETKDVVLDKGRVIYKNPNQRPRIQDGRPPITAEQIRNLPPAQRRRIRRILQRNNTPPDFEQNN